MRCSISFSSRLLRAAFAASLLAAITSCGPAPTEWIDYRAINPISKDCWDVCIANQRRAVMAGVVKKDFKGYELDPKSDYYGFNIYTICRPRSDKCSATWGCRSGWNMRTGEQTGCYVPNQEDNPNTPSLPATIYVGAYECLCEQ